ncbi:hypothetical protein ACIQF6_34090 [Kitasatospora sp. NPDC092948]|uniref:hypothetical protein n=1 Tax=Kitasatospora sp. NPDC092948 TaxID=3364088 RepID=UPI0037F6F45E
MDNPPTTTAGTSPWRELLSTVGETFNGSTADAVMDAVGRPEAAAYLADDALTSMEGLTELLSSPWALHTPEQVGAVAAALTAVQHHAEEAKGQSPRRPDSGRPRRRRTRPCGHPLRRHR